MDNKPVNHPGTNGFAIASFVTALVGIAVLGIVFGFVALDQIKQTGQEGRGFAIAGIAISLAYIGIFVLMILVMLLFFGAFAGIFAAL